MESNNNLPLYIKFALVSIGIFAIICTLYIAKGIILPLLYSLIIAIVLSPVVDFFRSKKIPKILAISLTLLLVLSIFILIFLLVSSQANMPDGTFAVLLVKFEQLIRQLQEWIANTFNIKLSRIKEWTGEIRTEVLNTGRYMAGQTLINIWGVAIVLVLMPVYIFMFLYYEPLLMEFIHKIFNSTKHKQLNQVLSATKVIIQSYLIGLLIEALIIATLNSTCLLIIGIDYAILLGVIGAILNIIPYIGGIIAVSLPIIIALATKSTTSALFVLVSYLVIQFIDNNYIINRVVAAKVQINALVSMIVVISGGALWGVPGMFLSIPLTAIIKVIFDHVDGLKPWGYLLGDMMPGKSVSKKKTIQIK